MYVFAIRGGVFQECVCEAQKIVLFHDLDSKIKLPTDLLLATRALSVRPELYMNVWTQYMYMYDMDSGGITFIIILVHTLGTLAGICNNASDDDDDDGV